MHSNFMSSAVFAFINPYILCPTWKSPSIKTPETKNQKEKTNPPPQKNKTKQQQQQKNKIKQNKKTPKN